MTDFALNVMYTLDCNGFLFNIYLLKWGDLLTIYLDAVWLLNILLDLMLLLVTKNLMKDTTKIRRITIGAFVASLIVPISIIYPEAWILSGMGKILFSVIIILSSFRWHSLKRFLSLWLMFYFVTFTIGGGLSAVYQMFSRPFFMSGHGIMTFGSGYGDPVSWIFVLLGFPIVLYFTKSHMDSFSIHKLRYQELYDVELTMFDQTYKTRGLLDSGNGLSDPLTKTPVVVFDELFFKKWFSDGEWSHIKKVIQTLNVDELDVELQSLVRIIPYRAVGTSNQFLLALKPQELTIFYGDEEITTDRVLVGLQVGSLHNQGDYHCLLNPSLVRLGITHTA